MDKKISILKEIYRMELTHDILVNGQKIHKFHFVKNLKKSYNQN